MKKVFKAVFIFLIIVIGIGVWLYVGSHITNPRQFAYVEDIPTPIGYTRIVAKQPAYANYLRKLPLKPRGSKVKLYTGGNANYQSLAYAVIDMPLLNNWEQCADACIRLRAEHLYQQQQYHKISFKNVNGKNITYRGGNNRKAFERYLKKLYGVASTFSLKHELKQRPISEVQPGDVFVYAAGDRRIGSKLGHAIMVVDVAEDRHGNKAVLLAEGNTPARDLHVLRNWFNPIASPWFYLDEKSKTQRFDIFSYKNEELKHF